MKTFKEYLKEEEQLSAADLDAQLTPDQKAQQDKSVAAMTQATAGMDDKKDDVMGVGIDAMIKTLPPEDQAAAKQFVVYNPDGTVDGDETMFKMADSFANIWPQLYQGFAGLVNKMDSLIQSKDPQFTELPPEQQQQVIKDVAEMKAYLPKWKEELDKQQADWAKQKQEYRKTLDQRATDRFKAKTGLDMVRGGAGQKTNIGFDPNNPGGAVGSERGYAGESADRGYKLYELNRIKQLAGLK